MARKIGGGGLGFLVVGDLLVAAPGRPEQSIVLVECDLVRVGRERCVDAITQFYEDAINLGKKLSPSGIKKALKSFLPPKFPIP